jgi:hypothetical protein
MSNPTSDRTEKVEGVFGRVSMPVVLNFTVDLSGLPDVKKKAVEQRIRRRLIEMTDIDGKIKLDKPVEPETAYAALAVPVMSETDSEGNPLFPLRGYKLLDVFPGTVEEKDWR